MANGCRLGIQAGKLLENSTVKLASRITTRTAVAAALLAGSAFLAPLSTHADSPSPAISPNGCGTSQVGGTLNWHSGAGTLKVFHNSCNNTAYATIVDSNSFSSWYAATGPNGGPFGEVSGQNYAGGGGGQTAPAVPYAAGNSQACGVIDNDRACINY